ncbi:hypothetical protein [Desulfovibrio sp. TomC]|uniref:hypothetical protein n=1 Tax=Desulfovibrio sp. TomC TaxID=1562888 RepID=UPI0012E21D24|nr:hypothetical protein [Desulfovibrio sp. TomC]
MTTVCSKKGTFLLVPAELHTKPIYAKKNGETSKVVEVSGIRPEYKKYYNKLATTVVKEIVEEFFPYFILNGWPSTFTVSFTDSGESEFNVCYCANYVSDTETFTLGQHDFSLFHVKNYQHDRHRVYYCASERVVSEHKSPVSNIIPKRQLLDESGNRYWYMGLVASKYLTDNISAERNIFLIPEKNDGRLHLDDVKDISLEEIDEAIRNII